MLDKLEKKKKKIDEQIEKNQLRKKLLIIKEKKERASKFRDIGKLAYHADIDQLDEKALLGAFLEISKNINEERLDRWTEIANDFKKVQSKKIEQVQIFSISFLEEPNLEIKQKLKEKKFLWNRFRKEYYGKSHRDEIENLLVDCKFKLEEIIN